MYMQTINERIKALRENLVLNQTEFAKTLGLKNPSNISMIERTKSGFNVMIVEKITKKYPNLNVDWLLKGEGSMWKSDYNYQKERNKIQNDNEYFLAQAAEKEAYKQEKDLLAQQNKHLVEILHLKDKHIENLKKPSALAHMVSPVQGRINFPTN